MFKKVKKNRTIHGHICAVTASERHERMYNLGGQNIESDNIVELIHNKKNK